MRPVIASAVNLDGGRVCCREEQAEQTASVRGHLSGKRIVSCRGSL